jgi:hypothetical protein
MKNLKLQAAVVAALVGAFIAYDIVGIWGTAVMLVIAGVCAALRYLPKADKKYAPSPLEMRSPVECGPQVIVVPHYIVVDAPAAQARPTQQPGLAVMLASCQPTVTDYEDAEWSPVVPRAAAGLHGATQTVTRRLTYARPSLAGTPVPQLRRLPGPAPKPTWPQTAAVVVIVVLVLAALCLTL